MALRAFLIRARLPLLAALLAATLVLAACNDGPETAVETDPESTSGANTAPADPTVAPDEEEPDAAKPAITESGGLKLEQIGEFRSPTHIAQPPGDDGLLVVAEKQGRLIAIRDGNVIERPFLDLHKAVRHQDTEQGLVSAAFAPDYQKSRRVYVSYTAGDEGNLRIEEYRVRSGSPDHARASSRREVMVIPQPNPIHNGGLLLFGPDGNLYIGAGDGGPSHDPFRRPQDVKQLYGKLLRINPTQRGKRSYTIPKGNPFHGPRRGLSEIYATGLRNPWRFSFDRESGLLTLGDVGQDFWEEINVLSTRKARGANFGWSGFEGTTVFNRDQKRRGTVKPALVYRHGKLGCSVTSGYIVRDPELPDLDGRYVYADFCAGELRSFNPRPGKKGKREKRLGLSVPAPVSFGEDNEGRIYVVSLTGPVYRLAPA